MRENDGITLAFVKECVVVGLLRKDPRNMMNLKERGNKRRIEQALKDLVNIVALANFGLQINQRVFGKKGVK